MRRFEALAERLPALYRPDEDDVGRRLPLAPGDIEAVLGPDGPLPATLTARGTGVLVALPRTRPVRALRLAPHTPAGVGHVLELRTPRAGTVPVTPTVVAPVRGRLARPTVAYRADRFTVQLVRRTALGVVLEAVADIVDRLEADATAVLAAHWLATADHATTDPWSLRSRELGGLPPLVASDPADLREIEEFHYLDDLGRLAALLSVHPWEEPPAARETVEAFRRRVRRVVALYREGLGTLGALRRMVEATLPELAGDDPDVRDRPFTVREHAPLPRLQAALTDGPPDGLVGPLMRWRVHSEGVRAAPATLYVQGVTPEPGQVEPTTDPVVERLAEPSGAGALAVAWSGTIEPGRTLRMRATFSSWLAGSEGVLVARRGAERPDPTAPGPWDAVVDGPPGPVTALRQAPDGGLWAASNDGGAGSLWRHDGASWVRAADGLPEVHTLGGDGDVLLVGTDDGLLPAVLHPAGGGLIELPAAPAGPGPVHDVAVLAPGRWLLATAAGLREAGPGSGAPPAGPVHPDGMEPQVHCVFVDRHGVRYFGLDRGLVVHQPGLDHWYAYLGEDVREDVADFERLLPRPDGRPVLPEADRVHLPAVLAIARDVDESLWLGTARGLARYRARPVQHRGFQYTTLLEAFPDLGDGPVHALRVDPFGLLWAATNRGLIRFDGRDLAQFRDAEEWVRLGRPERLGSEERGPWRFHAAAGAWQRWSERAGRRWLAVAPEERTSAETPVTDIVWTQGATADLLDGWDPATGAFSAAAPVDADTLSARYKPEPTRIVAGGIPAVPAVPPGSSTWRYLRREPADAPQPPRRPAWTVEGRLLPEPADVPARPEARFDVVRPLPRVFDRSVFPFLPAARVWLGWPSPQPLSVRVRLERVIPDEELDPLVLDRVWAGVERVRPAGVRVQLAVEEDLVRGGQ